jgi:hypothetical protein
VKKGQQLRRNRRVQFFWLLVNDTAQSLSHVFCVDVELVFDNERFLVLVFRFFAVVDYYADRLTSLRVCDYNEQIGYIQFLEVVL